VISYDQDGASGHRAAGFRRKSHRLAFDRRRRAVVEYPQAVTADGPPRVSGHTTYRSVIPTSKMPEDLRWNARRCGPDRNATSCIIRCRAGRCSTSSSPITTTPASRWQGQPVSEQEVMKGFAHLHERARNIIRHGKNWKLWVLCDRDPTERWIDGRVALLGDAAHPMLQYFAQGACQAMEDAVCLSHMLGSHPDEFATALEKYRRQRFPRTARVQLLSRAIGEHIYHPSGRTRPPAQRHHEREIVGGLVIATSRGCMAERGWGLIARARPCAHLR